MKLNFIFIIGSYRGALGDLHHRCVCANYAGYDRRSQSEE